MDINDKELTITNLFKFISLLNQLDNFYIEESRQLIKPINFQQLIKVNTGNSCLHYQLILNNHRIVIQTYKKMIHSKVDVVQGKIDSEPLFQEIVDFINTYGLTDNILNNIFISYFNWRNR